MITAGSDEFDSLVIKVSMMSFNSLIRARHAYRVAARARGTQLYIYALRTLSPIRLYLSPALSLSCSLATLFDAALFYLISRSICVYGGKLSL